MDIKDVEKLASLARIELPEDEKEQILKDMGSILEYVKQIEEVEVGDVAPDHTLHNAWREDAPDDRKFSRDSIIAQFPDSKDNFLKVKKILSND